jgi:hypothetical protein
MTGKTIQINGSMCEIVTMTFSNLNLRKSQINTFGKGIKSLRYSDKVCAKDHAPGSLPTGLGEYTTKTSLSLSIEAASIIKDMRGWSEGEPGQDPPRSAVKPFDMDIVFMDAEGKTREVSWNGMLLEGFSCPSEGATIALVSDFDSACADAKASNSDELVAYFHTDHILRNGVCMVPREETDHKAYYDCLWFKEMTEAGDGIPTWMKSYLPRLSMDWVNQENAIKFGFSGGVLPFCYVTINGVQYEASPHFAAVNSVARKVVELLKEKPITVENVRAMLDDPNCPDWLLKKFGADLDLGCVNLVNAAEKWVYKRVETT